MVDSVSGSQRQIPIETLQRQQRTEDIQELEKVSSGYNGANSVSHRVGDSGFNQFRSGAELAPSIPEPNSATTPTGEELDSMRTQSLTSQVRAGLLNSFDLIAHTQPELITPEITSRAQGLNNQLGSIQSATTSDLGAIAVTASSLGEAVQTESLDTNKLEQIMSELTTKLQDNSIKFAEVEIKGKAAEAEKTATENITNLREYIDESNSNKGIFGLKIALSVLFPPLAVWEGIQAIVREATHSDNGLSIFSSSAARSQAFGKADSKEGSEKLVDDSVWALGWDIESGEQVNNTNVDRLTEERAAREEGNGQLSSEAPSLANPGSVTIQGLEVAQAGLSHAEMMQLLQQQQQSEESSQALEEAIAALESGDPQAAEEILGSTSGSSDLSSNAGIEAAVNAPAPQGPPSTSEPTVNEQAQVNQEVNDLLETLAEIPEQTAATQENLIREQGLIQRHRRA